MAGHVGAVDFARYAVGRGVPHELGFDEVAAPINALRVVVLEQDTAYESHAVHHVKLLVFYCLPVQLRRVAQV